MSSRQLGPSAWASAPHDRSPRASGRRELKYVVRPATARRILQFVRRHLTLDAHAQHRPAHAYTVRSVYYDSQSLECFRAKLGGQRFREKYRLRTYNEPGSAPLRFELKQKRGAGYAKHKLPIDSGALASEGAGTMLDWLPGESDTPAGEVARQRVLFKLRRRAYRPIVLVTYDREAYTGRGDETTRVTFDRHLRVRAFPPPSAMHDETGWRYPLGDWVIVEVKFTRLVPPWMGAVHGRLQLKTQACSKYCTAVAAALGVDARTRRQHHA